MLPINQESRNGPLQAQAEPEISLEIEGPWDGYKLAVSNEGAFWVVDISIYYDTLLFWGPPWHQDSRGIYRLPGSRSPGWWHIEKLGPGEVQTHAMEDATHEALDFWLLPVWLTPAYANSACISNSIGLR